MVGMPAAESRVRFLNEAPSSQTNMSQPTSSHVIPGSYSQSEGSARISSTHARTPCSRRARSRSESLSFCLALLTFSSRARLRRAIDRSTASTCEM